MPRTSKRRNIIFTPAYRARLRDPLTDLEELEVRLPLFPRMPLSVSGDPGLYMRVVPSALMVSPPALSLRGEPGEVARFRPLLLLLETCTSPSLFLFDDDPGDGLVFVFDPFTPGRLLTLPEPTPGSRRPKSLNISPMSRSSLENLAKLSA